MHIQKFYCTILSVSLFFFLSILHAQDIRISGGLNYSAAITTSGELYAWGSNTSVSLTATVGGLGTGSSAANVLLPEKVIFPANDPYFKGVLGLPTVYIKEVDAGTGSTMTALDTKSGVWSVGYNNMSYFKPNAGDTVITGTGSSAETVTSIARVLKGEYTGPSIDPSVSAYLTNVKSVNGGNLSNYALLNSGEAMAWGMNFSGQLGNGSYAFSSTPKYILTAPGTKLTGIIQIESGDNTGYALVDPDGDGVGTVYSWGNGISGQLGRIEDGTRNYARQVNISGVPLSNIVRISAGNVMCFALDTEGYVWAWGNHGWGGLCGIGRYIYTNFYTPRKVVAGLWATTPGNENEIFLKARSIAGGQGFGMAVSIDGIPLAWGNNTVQAFNNSPSGGLIGNGVTTKPEYFEPQLILTGPGTYDTDVLSITDGDVFGFYTTGNGSIKTWGHNADGELGIGNQVTQYYAVPFNLINPIAIPDPQPFAKLTVKKHTTCINNPQLPLLNAHFPVSGALTSNYSFTWYRNGVLIPDAKGPTYQTTSETGTYRVVVSYVGSSTPMNTVYADAQSTITIQEEPFSFTAVKNSYCDEEGMYTFRVNGYPENQTAYKWHAQSGGGSPLIIDENGGTNELSNSITTALKHAVKEGNVYKLWAEDATGLDVTVIDKPTCTNTAINYLGTNSALGFSLSETSRIKLKSVDVYAAYPQSSTLTYNVFIYADANGPKFDSIVAASDMLSIASTNEQMTFPANLDLSHLIKGNVYWLGITLTNSGMVYQDYSDCAENLPVSGAADMLHITGNYSKSLITNKIGTFYNMRIIRGWDNVCKRVEVDLTAAVDTSVTVNGQSLSANQANATYQWIDWDNAAAIIPEATEQLFTPAADGNYGVIVTTETCSDTSGIHSLNENPATKNTSKQSSSSVIVYPNPATKNITVQLQENNIHHMYVMNVNGQILLEKTLSDIRTEVSIENLKAGIYILKISSDGIYQTQQLVVF